MKLDLENNNDNYLLCLVGREVELHQKLIEKYSEELNLMPEGSISEKLINGKKRYYHLTVAENSGKWHQKYIP